MTMQGAISVGAIAVCWSWHPALAATPPVDPALLQALAAQLDDSASFTDSAEAQVWLLDMSIRLQRYVVDPQHRLTLLRTVHAAARANALPPELVLAVIEVESAFDAKAISSAGALGLMQVMPFWTRELGRDDDNLLDPRINIRYGCTILAHYLHQESGDWRRALNRYNGRLHNNGYGDKVLTRLRQHWFKQ
jgi:soluble lytic murein transglycosylase-like protein